MRRYRNKHYQRPFQDQFMLMELDIWDKLTDWVMAFGRPTRR